MADPVMLCTGHTYDRVCIERWFSQGEDTCPVTGLTLDNFHMTPNHACYALRNAAQDWAADHGDGHYAGRAQPPEFDGAGARKLHRDHPAGARGRNLGSRGLRSAPLLRLGRPLHSCVGHDDPALRG